MVKANKGNAKKIKVIFFSGPATPTPSSLVAKFFGDFSELKKSSFFLVARPLPPLLELSGHRIFFFFFLNQK